MTFAEKVISFNNQLHFDKRKLPVGLYIMNPFKEHDQINAISGQFYQKYYSDHKNRKFIIGINPGRLGAGLTGVPFTDPKHLQSQCNIHYPGKPAHEPSSVFVYDVINAFGGVSEFYSKFYINSICPLGFISVDAAGKRKNYNYYDSRELTMVVYDFMIENIEKQLDFGIDRDICFCLGASDNLKFLYKINSEKKYFKHIIGLEHPRFIMQYKSKSKQFYIDKYVSILKSETE